jgi:hypothetical protein
MYSSRGCVVGAASAASASVSNHSHAARCFQSRRMSAPGAVCLGTHVSVLIACMCLRCQLCVGDMPHCAMLLLSVLLSCMSPICFHACRWVDQPQGAAPAAAVASGGLSCCDKCQELWPGTEGNMTSTLRWCDQLQQALRLVAPLACTNSSSTAAPWSAAVCQHQHMGLLVRQGRHACWWVDPATGSSSSSSACRNAAATWQHKCVSLMRTAVGLVSHVFMCCALFHECCVVIINPGAAETTGLPRSVQGSPHHDSVVLQATEQPGIRYSASGS